MFIGTEIAKLQENNQITLPAEFVDPSGNELILTAGFEHNLMLFPINIFVALLSKLNSMNILDPEVRQLHRLLVGKAVKVNVNDADQIELSDALLGKTKIAKDAVLVGQGSYIEIWSVDQWTIEKSKVEEFTNNMEHPLDLSL